MNYLNKIIFLVYLFGDWGLGPIPNPQSPYRRYVFCYIFKLKKLKFILIYDYILLIKTFLFFPLKKEEFPELLELFILFIDSF